MRKNDETLFNNLGGCNNNNYGRYRNLIQVIYITLPKY